MNKPLEPSEFPEPTADWVDQHAVAKLLGISTKTASAWAKMGKLRIYEHGVMPCGRRKYSRSLLRRQVERGWAQAVKRQDRGVAASSGGEVS